MVKSMKLYLVTMATLSQIEHCSSPLSPDTKSMTPIYFFNFTTSISRPGMKNFHCGKITKDLFCVMGMLLSNEDPHFVTIKKRESVHELVENQTCAFWVALKLHLVCSLTYFVYWNIQREFYLLSHALLSSTSAMLVFWIKAIKSFGNLLSKAGFGMYTLFVRTPRSHFMSILPKKAAKREKGILS